MPTTRFKTKLIKIGTRTILRLPKTASAQLPSRGQVMTEGTINNAAFQIPLEPDGMNGHWFTVDARLQKAAKASAGSTVTVTITPTRTWSEPSVPADVQAALSAHPKAHTLWKTVTPLARHEWIRWISATIQPKTRNRRIEAACSKLTAGERRPCCFNRNMCCVPEVSKNGVLLVPQ